MNGAGVNDIPGDRINPCYIQMSLQFNHSIKVLVITRHTVLTDIFYFIFFILFQFYGYI